MFYKFFRTVNYIFHLTDLKFGAALPFVKHDGWCRTDLTFHLSGSNKEANKGYGGVHQQSGRAGALAKPYQHYRATLRVAQSQGT